jgi:hypothetical protein
LVFTTTILGTYLHIKKLYLKEINKLFYIRASIFKFRNTRETTIYINCIKEKKKKRRRGRGINKEDKI